MIRHDDVITGAPSLSDLRDAIEIQITLRRMEQSFSYMKPMQVFANALLSLFSLIDFFKKKKKR